MNKYLKSTAIIMALPFLVFLTSFLGDEKNNFSNPSGRTEAGRLLKENSSISTRSVDAPVAPFYNLFVEAKEFTKLPNGKKLVLAHTFRDPDILTLYGWPCKNRKCSKPFEDKFAIEFSRGKLTEPASSYGANVIFANVFIGRKDIVKIKNKYGTEYKYVVFVPSLAGESIKYTIYVTKTDPKSTVGPLALEPTGVEANPSPPKN